MNTIEDAIWYCAMERPLSSTTLQMVDSACTPFSVQLISGNDYVIGVCQNRLLII